MRPESPFVVKLEATVSPSEDPHKVLAAVTGIIGESPMTTVVGERSISVSSISHDSLDRLHDQLRDRRVRGAAKRRFFAGRSGKRTTVMINRQAASVGVIALCDSEDESSLGPIYLTLESKDLDALLQWLTDYPEG